MSTQVPPRMMSRFNFLPSVRATRISECAMPPTMKTMVRFCIVRDGQFRDGQFSTCYRLRDWTAQLCSSKPWNEEPVLLVC